MVARKAMRLRWALLIQVATGLGGTALSRLVWSSSHSTWTGYGAASAVPVAAVATVTAALTVQRVHARGETVRGVLRQRRQRARALVDSPEKLRVQAPAAAAVVTLISFPAVFLALATAASTGGVRLEPAADARLQLWCIAAAALIASFYLDCWYGRGIWVRGLATDGFTAAVVGCTVALAAASPLMTFHHVESRVAWLGVAVAQFGWPFAGGLLAAAVSGRRKSRLDRAANAAPDIPVGGFGEPGIGVGYDLTLQCAGSRKIQVIKEVRRVTRLGLKEAKDLVDGAPALVLRQVSGDEADRAKNLLESVGATVVVTCDSDEAGEIAAP